MLNIKEPKEIQIKTGPMNLGQVAYVGNRFHFIAAF